MRAPVIVFAGWLLGLPGAADAAARMDPGEWARARELQRAEIAAGIVMRALDTDNDERISREEAAVADRLGNPGG